MKIHLKGIEVDSQTFEPKLNLIVQIDANSLSNQILKKSLDEVKYEIGESFVNELGNIIDEILSEK